MIEDLNIDERQSLFQAPGKNLVRMAGFGYPGGVVVRKDDRGGVVPESGLDDFPWVDRGLGQRTGEEILDGSHVMLRIQEQRGKDFSLQAMQAQAQEISYRGRTRQSVVGTSAFLENLQRCCDDVVVGIEWSASVAEGPEAR